MMKTQKKSAPSTDKHDRRRGRPAGKNRTPLSQEERRARNAQYERERRNETADAMVHLAEAAGCDPQISNAELLATVISQFQRRARSKYPQDIDDLRRINENLESQIAALQSRLGQDVDVSSITEDLNNFDPEAQNNITPEELSEVSESNMQAEVTNKRKKIKCQHPKKSREADIQTRKGEMMRSSKIRKTSKSSSVSAKIAYSGSGTQSESDSSNSDWFESEKIRTRKYQLRKRSRNVSEQSECSSTSYPYRTQSESSQCGTLRSLELHSDNSNQSDALENPINKPDENDLVPSAIPELNEDFIEHFDDQSEAVILGTLTEGEQMIVNEWLEGPNPLQVKVDGIDNRVLKFLDFDDFLLDISST